MSEREEFEKWATSDGVWYDITKDEDDTYLDDNTFYAFVGWQAARAVPPIPEQPSQDVVDQITAIIDQYASPSKDAYECALKVIQAYEKVRKD